MSTAQPAAEGVPPAGALKPARQLDCTLCEIVERYGASRRERVMMEMQYARVATACLRVIDGRQVTPAVGPGCVVVRTFR